MYEREGEKEERGREGGRKGERARDSGAGGFAMQSAAPAAHSGTPSCMKVSLARAPSLMRVRARLSGWLGQRRHVAAVVHAGRWAVGLIGGA